jgi:hypothetical protein
MSRSSYTSHSLDILFERSSQRMRTDGQFKQCSSCNPSMRLFLVKLLVKAKMCNVLSHLADSWTCMSV